MTLRVSDFDQYLLASAQIDYLELRLGEAFAISMEFTQNDGVTPLDITNWSFAVSYQDALATVTGTGKTLTSITNFKLLSNTQLTDANLQVTNVLGPQGLAVLTLPSTVTNMPSANAPIDATNTLVKLLKIVCTYPSTVAGFNNTRNLAIGGIIRFA